MPEAVLDQVVLQAIVEEFEAVLTGRPLDDVVQLETHRFLLRFGEAPYPRLHVAIHPRLSTVHLARGIKAPSAPTELAVALTRELAGRRITRVVKPPAERLARLEFDGGRTLVIELMGKASNLLLLDEDERIIRYARTHHGEFRQPVEGEAYIAPAASPGWMDIDPARLDSESFRGIVAGLRDQERLEDRLVATLPGCSLQIAREVGARARGGEDPWQVFAGLLGRVERGDWSPMLYSPGALAELPEWTPLSSRNLFAFVFPLAAAARAGLEATPMPTVNAAEEAATSSLLRHMTWAALQQSLSSLLRHEKRRLVDLTRVLEAEMAQAAAGGEEDRRRAELILAGMSRARKEGSVVRVVDHYDPQARTVEIPIDPRLDLNENAQRYFRSARRRERTLERVPQRLESMKTRLADVSKAEQLATQSRTRAELESLEKELQANGLVRAFRRTDRAEVGRKPEYVQVREFRTTDGFTVLVGKTGAENDHLTFKVAAPHDLWLHAAGFPGAHVVVRNPRRVVPIPETTVRQAAAIAAYFSKGKFENELDVHVAWRRHVRKGRGMSPGMVMLKKHQTVRVAPALPAPTHGAD